PEPDHIPVRILHLNLLRPRKVSRLHTQLYAARHNLFAQSHHIPHANPNPRLSQSLPTQTQINSRLVAVHARKFLHRPFRILESELLHIELDGPVHVLHAQNRLAVFEIDPFIRHLILRTFRLAVSYLHLSAIPNARGMVHEKILRNSDLSFVCPSST